MDRCIVCDMEKPENEWTLRCKMCSMNIENKVVMYGGFGFCCRKCIGHFRNIWDMAGKKERLDISCMASFI